MEYLSGNHSLLRCALMRQVVIAFALASSVGACSDACRDRAVVTELAPGGSQRAVLFQRDCGATSGFSSQVSVTAVDATVSGLGNAFVADTDYGRAKAAGWGGPWLELRWISPQRLLIRYDKAARVFTRQDDVPGVKVDYEAVAR